MTRAFDQAQAARSRAWYLANREYCLEKERTRQATPGYAAKRAAYMRHRLSDKGKRVEQMLYHARRRAASNGVPFRIGLVDLMPLPTRCAALGIRLDYGPGNAPNHVSIDRIVNGKGYVPGNVHIISCRANSLKGNASTDELRAVYGYALRMASRA